MNNRTIALFAAAASLVLLALPAHADQAGTYEDTTVFNHEKATLIATFAEQGLNVSGVEEWSNYIRAYVVEANGTTTMKFFDKDRFHSVVPGQN